MTPKSTIYSLVISVVDINGRSRFVEGARGCFVIFSVFARERAGILSLAPDTSIYFENNSVLNWLSIGFCILGYPNSCITWCLLKVKLAFVLSTGKGMVKMLRKGISLTVSVLLLLLWINEMPLAGFHSEESCSHLYKINILMYCDKLIFCITQTVGIALSATERWKVTVLYN